MPLSDYNMASSRVIYTLTPYSFTLGLVSYLIINVNVARKYLAVQNKHATANCWMTIGYVATTSYGLKIPPGGNVVFDTAIPIGAVYLIGDVAANTDINVIEGV